MVYTSFGEIYKYIAKASRLPSRIEEIMAQEIYTLVVMDGMSLRESPLLKRRLAPDYHVSTVPQVAPLPTDTKFFTSRYFSSSSPSQLEKRPKEGFTFYRVGGQQDVSSIQEDERLVVWSRLPDKYLHTHTEAFQLSDLEDDYLRSEELLLSILHRLNKSGKEIYVCSDHGYIPDTHTWTSVRDFPSSKRYTQAIPESCRSYSIRVNNQWMIFGRFNTVKRGKYGHVRHGGLSFLESITPFLTITKR